MKNYIIGSLMLASVLGGNAVYAQNTKQKAGSAGPCTTMGTTAVHHHKKHHPKKIGGVAAVAKPHKAIVHRRHIINKEPIRPTLETISVDNHSATTIVSIKNGDVYINDSLVTVVKNPQCEDHRLIINYIAPPPPPAVTDIEQLKTNTYTGEKAEGMLGVWGSSNCCEDGVVIDDVMPGSPACKAGLGRGDVITKINDQRINSGNDLAAALKTMSAGDNIAVTVKDYDGTETKNIELAKKDLPANCACR